jgi:hypothetical protein
MNPKVDHGDDRQLHAWIPRELMLWIEHERADREMTRGALVVEMLEVARRDIVARAKLGGMLEKARERLASK